MEMRNAFVQKESWIHGNDAIGIVIPASSSSYTPIPGEPRRNWVLRRRSLKSKDKKSADIPAVEECSFHYAGCRKGVSVGHAMLCNICTTERNTFFGRCARAEKIRSKPLAASTTSVKRIKLDPELMAQKSAAQTKRIKELAAKIKRPPPEPEILYRIN
jgi:hypothetical protein